MIPEYWAIFLLLLYKIIDFHCRKFGKEYKNNDFVCKWQNGEPLKCDYVSHHFKDVLKKNHIREIKFHSLRHSCATALVNSNEVSLVTLQAMLGHSTLDMTRKYIHPDMQEKIKATSAVSSLISNARSGVKLW